MATEIKSDQIKSEKLVAIPSANKPTSPVEGMVFRADGTGDSAKGLYEYKNSKWVSLDQSLDSMESVSLITSGDTTALQFAAALNSTSTAAGHKNAVPHEVSTGALDGTFTVPTTGSDALFTDRNAHLVFRYASSGTASCKNDYVGITIDIPAAFRGQNLVAEFQYRTEEATTASSNNDFQLSVWDKTNGKSITSTDTGVKTAGQDIAVSSKTGLAVGDKIWLESGGNAVGHSDNTITQSYITAISGTADTITISADWTPASTAGSRLVTKFLSDYDIGLPEADSDTDKDGSTYKLAFKTEATTDQVNLYWQNKSTTANSLELFFDGILVSANKFLQASSQTQAEQGLWYGRGGTNGFGSTYNGVLLPSDEGYNTISQYGTVELSATDGFSFTANQRCRVNMNVSCAGATGTMFVGISKNATGTELTSAINVIPATKRIALTWADGSQGNATATFSGIVEKGDILRPGAGLVVTYDGTYDEGMIISMLVESDSSDVILLESQDEIFTDWQSYTDVFYTTNWASGGANTIRKAIWRRVGGDMELKVDFVLNSTGTVTSDYAIIKLPSGYTIDTSKTGGGQKTVVGSYIAPYSTNAFNNAGSGGIVATRDGYDSYLYLSYQANGADLIELNSINAIASTSTMMCVNAKVPIQGWNANFNPLLSMPLVDLGHPVECYIAYLQNNFWTGTAGGHQHTWDKTKLVPQSGSPTLATSNLITISNITSGTNTVTAITAKQDISMTVGLIGRTAANGFVGFYNSSDQIISMQGQSETHWEAESTVRLTLSSGDYIYGYLQDSSTSYGLYGAMTLTAEKTLTGNMAHIIKPAVAYAKDIKASTDDGDGTVHGAWRTRTLQTLEGESWFMTLSSNIITLEPGTYKIKGRYLIARSDAVSSRLYSTTDGATLAVGETGQVGSGDYISQEIECLKTFTASHSFTLQYQCQTTAGGGDASRALGMNSAASGSTESWCAASVRVEKLK